jgi:hypothetical protein
MRTKTTLYSGLMAMGMMLCLSTQPALGLVTVTVSPGSQVVFAGSNAVFTAQVSATAGETITAYTWLTSPNGQNPFTTVPGATTATCTLVNVQTNNTGFYFVRVTYNSGTNIGLTLPSQEVTLTVVDQARITVQPPSVVSELVGATASLSVTAQGFPPPGYQWRFNGMNLLDNDRVSGANGTNLTVSALVTADSGGYDVVVTNAYSAVTSQVAMLTVYLPVGITVPPQNTAVVLGSNAVLSVTASGTGLIYQWQRGGTNLLDGGRISGATTDLLTIAATTTNDAGDYTVLVSNPASAPITAVATLTVLVPATFTSATNQIFGRQGVFLSFTNTATGTTPITFGADGLPAGLSVDPVSGVLSGIPAVMGVFDVTVYATNAAMTTTEQLVITLTTGIPGITSRLSASGKQGQNFSYTIIASNNPTSFSASGLPAGVDLDPATGVMAGPPIVSGTFPVTIVAANQYGAGSQVLTLTLASSVPVITSPVSASWTENLSGFSYTIQASDSPTLFGASGLPLGLMVDTNSGAITGTPLYGGTFTVPIWAINAWGTGSTNLVLNLSYATIGGLAITDVLTNWAKPYLLNFTFSLRDGPDPSTSSPVVVPPSQLQVVCMEDGVPIPSEAPVILESGLKKQLKSYLVLDYTYSMLAAPGAIDAMQAAAELLIDEEPTHALFGIYEFNADYVAPQLVTTNGLIANKATLIADIEGIQTNYVKGNYAGTRCWDAMYAALKQFGPFGPTNSAEQRYLIAMTDGNDSSSLLNTNTNVVATLVSLAQTNQVRIFCVAFGNDVNTNALQELTSQTGGHYYLAATTADLALEFQKIVKDIDGQYVLRWATLTRTPEPFQPSFQVSYEGFTDTFNTNLLYGTNTDYTTNIVVDPTQNPPVTNITIITNVTVTNIVVLPFNPSNWAGNVLVGSVQLMSDADVGPQTIRLYADYVPRFIREIQINYRPNYPCTAFLDSTGTNDILYGWSMTETTDTNGLRTLTMVSSDTNNLLTSIEYAAFGDLVEFDFTYPDSVTAAQAFSVFSINNNIYSNMQPTGQSLVLQNATNFITLYPPAPPHGTPIPWLIYYGFKTNFAAAELIATNGLPLWQDYVAGLNPTNANSKFTVSTAFAPGQTPQIIFSTVAGRTYRVETATSLDTWAVLRDNIPGTGGNILFIDDRVLSGVSAVFYRVAVY